MLDIFRPKPKKDLHRKFDSFSQQLVQAFAQIKTDIQDINFKLNSQQSELERLGQWTTYLHRYGQRISDSHEKITKKQAKIEENHEKLHSSHQAIQENHTKSVERLENKHQEISNQLLDHKTALKTAINTTLDGHKEITKREIESLKAWVTHVSSSVERQSQNNVALKQDIADTQHAIETGQSALRELVNALKEENISLKGNLTELSQNLAGTRSELDEAKNSVNLAKNHVESLKSELNEVKSRPAQVVQAPVVAPQPQVAPPQPIQSTLTAPHPQGIESTGFERHIMSRVMPNRKGYVLKFILDLVGENRFSTKEIEEIVVKEKRLCGRTSFYAYLKELRYRGKISTAEIDERSILVSTERQATLAQEPNKAPVARVPSETAPEASQEENVSETSSEPSETPKKDFDDMVNDFHSE